MKVYSIRSVKQRLAMPSETFRSTTRTQDAALILGRTQNTSGSELTAGMRAQLIPSPHTAALSSPQGQLIAQTLITLARYHSAANFMRVRLPLLKEAVRRGIPEDKPYPLIVDPAVGFATFGVELAHEFPHARFVDIDVSSVIETRQGRLSRASISPPPNLKTIRADLSGQRLDAVLEGQAVDVINFTGAYFTHDELRMTLPYLYELLAPGGVCVCYLPWMPGVDQIRFATRLFKNRVGSIDGAVTHLEQIDALFHDARFRQVQVYFPSRFAAELGYSASLLDLEVLVLAKK